MCSLQGLQCTWYSVQVIIQSFECIGESETLSMTAFPIPVTAAIIEFVPGVQTVQCCSNTGWTSHITHHVEAEQYLPVPTPVPNIHIKGLVSPTCTTRHHRVGIFHHHLKLATWIGIWQSQSSASVSPCSRANLKNQVIYCNFFKKKKKFLQISLAIV